MLENKHLFNGVELNSGTGYVETLFRLYDPALGRFIQIDPLAEIFTGINPYSFGYNNPITYGDPNGLAPDPKKRESRISVFFRKLFNIQPKMPKEGSGKGLRHPTKPYQPNPSPSPGPSNSPNKIDIPDFKYGPSDFNIGKLGEFAELPEDNIQQPELLRDPTWGISPGGSVSISRRIIFKEGSTSFEDYSSTERTLRDIAEGLRRNESLTLTLYINVAIGSSSPTRTGGGDALNQRNFALNNLPHNVDARELMDARGNTIKALLKRMGIHNVVVIKPGQIIIGSRGREVQFNLEYNDD